MLRPILAAADALLPISVPFEDRLVKPMGEMEGFYAKLLELPSPWQVTKVRLDARGCRVDIWLREARGNRFACPDCGELSPVYDHAEESVWRHLDTCQCQTYLHARLPRVRCVEHGVRQLASPWASPGSSLTMAGESRVIDTLKECDITGAGRLTGLGWDRIWRVLELAVARGQARKKWRVPRRLAVDEKSFRKRHDYETLVCDAERGTVEFVADHRRESSLAAYFIQFSPEELAEVRSVSMDMWEPYIKATTTYVPTAEQKIVFDRFHVVRYVTDAVDKVRRSEHRQLTAQNDERLKGTKHLWLANLDNVPERRRAEFEILRKSKLRTGRAWAIKEAFREFWNCASRGEAETFFENWFLWVTRTKLQPMISAAKTIKKHLANILTYFTHRVTNATAEGLNSKIQMVKEMACGFRNREHYKTAIYFHCGGLDLYPRPAEA